ncbi:MAG: MATE family efflux transporter [Lachnospiraceae bacterium]|nr:MATE family efflux transporter [Lachnospiraceae bacterium]
MNTAQDFGKDFIWKLISKTGIPAIISMIVVVIYNMADTFFVGQTHNDMMVAAVSLAAPIFTLMITVGTLIGSGGCAVISNVLGAGNQERAKHISSFCVYASVAIGLLFTAALLIFAEPVLLAIGATENTISFACSYTHWIAIGAVFIIFSNTLSNIIRAEGAARESMIGNLIGTITNIVLDPIMILCMGMGVQGAAVATVIGNMFACLFYVYYFYRKKDSLLSLSLKDFSMRGGIASSVFSIGLPGALGNLLMSFSNIFMNILLAGYGDNAVAAMGVAMKVGMIVVMLQMGLATGVLPILSYNYGAENFDRLKETIKKSGIVCMGLGVILTVICFTVCEAIVSSFVTGAEVITLGIDMTKAIILSGPFIGLYFLCISIMQALGKSTAPIIVSLLRQGIIYVPLMYLLNYFFELNGLIYTQLISDYIGILAAIIACTAILKSCIGNKELCITEVKERNS